MGRLSDQDRSRLADYLIQGFTPDTAGDMDSFARHYLHSTPLWDRLADLFPDAAPSQLRAAMMEAWARWSEDRGAPSGLKSPS